MVYTATSLETEHSGDYAHAVSFGKNVRRLRENQGLQQKELARKLGVKQSALSSWERDRSGLPETPTLLRFAKGLGCSVDDLLVGVDAAYDQIVIERRDLSSHADAASSSSAPSQAQRKGTHDDAGAAAATRVLSHQIGRRQAFVRDVQNVADILRELITMEERRITRETEDAPAHAPQRRTHRRKAG